MKNRISSIPSVILGVMLAATLVTPVLLAQTSAPAPTAQPAPVQLSAGVWDVLRLAHGNVGDATITAYIKNSGKVYPLGASEILYLRDQGLSDQVITAMLEQQKNVAATAAQPASQLAPNAQPSVWANEGNPPYVPTTTQPAPAYVQPAPVYAQPSPVYVYPPSYSYYDYWPYYGSYWGYPGVSFSFGWGGRYGGYRGGGYHGGGFHGGGHLGGGHFGGGGHR